jgi:rare lipoprotein A
MPASSSEKLHGIDPDYRCIGAALWRWWRILGSPSRYLVIANQPTIKKSRCLMVAALQMALLGPTSAANSKSDECGLASVYSTNSEETASGEDTQPQNFTGAHRSLPFGTLVHVGNQENGRSVVIRITDRGPFVGERIIDLSEIAARELRITDLAQVCLNILPVQEGRSVW